MLEFAQLFGVDRATLQQRSVAVLALAHRIDFALQLGDLPVEVLESDLHHGQPITGLLVQRLHAIEFLLLGQISGAVVHAAQLGIDLGQIQQ